MKSGLKNVLKKNIPDIYIQYMRGVSLEDISDSIADDLVYVVNKKYKCVKCEEKIPQNNIGIEK
jgi:hypothetical protein